MNRVAHHFASCPWFMVIVVQLLFAGCAIQPRQTPDLVIPDAHGGGKGLAIGPDSSKLASAGWTGETRKVSGHLTLCRVRNSKAGVKLAQMTEGYKDFKLGTVSAGSVSVYQSQLTPKGPVYTVLGNYKLQ